MIEKRSNHKHSERRTLNNLGLIVIGYGFSLAVFSR